MLYDYMNMLESVGLDLLFASIFFLIGMAIKDVLKQGNVPPFGRVVGSLFRVRRLCRQRHNSIDLGRQRTRLSSARLRDSLTF